MTTHQPFPKNRVILYGVVDRRNDRDTKKVSPDIRRYRNPTGGADYTVNLQVASPYGGSYKIEVNVGPVNGAEIFASCPADQPVILTGHLTRMPEVDRRFREYDATRVVEGIFYQDVEVRVEAVRLPTETDPTGTGSNIALEGEVVEPPIFMRHPDIPDLELARVGIRARTQAMMDETGQILPARACLVTVVIPVDDEHAELLYRRGNRVQIRGALERLAVRQTGREEVRERLGTLAKEWEEQWHTLHDAETHDATAISRAGNAYLRQRDRLSRSVRTVVVAVGVTPLAEATPLDREAAALDRDLYDEERREANRHRRMERSERRRRNRQHERLAKEEPSAPEQPTEEGHEQASVSPLNHRRRKPTLSPHDGPPADHEGPATIGGWE
ncbi:MAG: hypothetical protein EI684_21745 [Candidatus Viridilinea halotolerans]|uniref:Uncharacterized protein n=1 Tax=Candidatus Viridilinea halotolerans TaxID=2491704 RepID=A0A426TR73_9CHLR|nr:MAG: hypothetical protein EI684_21745 [Candidatus Viridilinea halotolerans]